MPSELVRVSHQRTITTLVIANVRQPKFNTLGELEMRRSICLAIIALLVIARHAASDSGAQQPDEDRGATELRKLLVERRDALQGVVDAMESRYKNGPMSFEPLAQARDEYLLAELELATSKQQRVEQCEKRIENLRANEEWVTAKTERGTGKSEEILLATAARLQAEIDCVREKLKP